MSSDLIADVKRKIDREQNIINSSSRIRESTNNVAVKERCNSNIREAQQNLEYLQQTLDQLSLHSQGKSHHPPNFTGLDLIKYDCPSLGHRIQYMMQLMEFKLQIENQYKEASEKMIRLYQSDADKHLSTAALGGRIESNKKIPLLTRALKRYRDMHVDIADVREETDILHNQRVRAKPPTGIITLGISSLKDVDHIANNLILGRRIESVILIKVDDELKVRTKPFRNGRLNEPFSFQIAVAKNNELEISVCDKVGDQLIPVAVAWIMIADIVEELRRKRKQFENLNNGWVSASNMPVLSPGVGHNPHMMPSSGDSSSSSTLVARSADTVFGAGPTHAHSDPRETTSTGRYILEPSGQVVLTFGFVKTDQRPQENNLGGLGRHGAIRERKEATFEQHGHHFVQKNTYNIMMCAYCGEFARYLCYQCEDCKYCCHKKCYKNVVTKCILKSSNEVDPDEAKLNHKIPHRFEPVSNRGTKWCCHCGYILPWGKKNVRKCLECGIVCHSTCAHLVPDFCGMSMVMANKILNTIKLSGSRTNSPVKSSFSPQVANQKPYELQSSVQPQALKPEQEYSHQNYSRQQYEQNQYEQAQHEHNYQDLQYGRQPQPPAHNNRNLFLPVLDNSYNIAPGAGGMGGIDIVVEDFGDSKGQYDVDDMPSLQEVPNPFDQEAGQTQDPYYNDYGLRTSQDQRPLFDYVPEEDTVEPLKFNRQSMTPYPDEPIIAPSPPVEAPRKKKKHRKVGLDDFQFLAVLGKGNFGKVMLAESRHSKKLCAIKVLKKDFILENDEVESTKSEKRVFLIANQERHPFLINLHCCFQTANRIYFVMEYISGGDLMWHIQKLRFSQRRAQFYAAEVLLGLKYFHDNGVIYRDLKLDNILLTVQGHIKIADYGLCKEDMWYGSTTLTFCGTPEFMAPEILKEQKYGKAVDWWAYGVLLYQMLLGQSPFKGHDEEEIFNAIMTDDPLYPIQMARESVEILQALLTRDETKRLGYGPRDAEEIMEHPYFLNTNFDDILNLRIEPPYLPEVKSEHDVSNFDDEFTAETPRLTPVNLVLDSSMQEKFRGFSHMSSDFAI